MNTWQVILGSCAGALLITLPVLRIFRAAAKEAKTLNTPGSACDRCGADAKREPLQWTHAAYRICRRCAIQLSAEGRPVSGPPLN